MKILKCIYILLSLNLILCACSGKSGNIKNNAIQLYRANVIINNGTSNIYRKNIMDNSTTSVAKEIDEKKYPQNYVPRNFRKLFRISAALKRRWSL